MAEKYSKFRDPGTGIQVFLTPVAPASASSAGSILLTPLFAVLGLIRTIIALLAWGLYLASSSSFPLRIVLFSLGFWSVRVENVKAGRTKQTVAAGKGELGRGDVVVSNHSSWVDLLILAYLYPGIKFAVPVIDEAARTALIPTGTPAGKRAPKANAMSANTRIVTPSSLSTSSLDAQIEICGWTVLPSSTALSFVGSLPPSTSQLPLVAKVHPTLDAALQASEGPLAIFPEIVTSNGRALLNIPSFTLNTVKTTTAVSIKYAPATPLTCTSAYSVPSPTNSKLNHLVQILLLSSPVRSVTLRRTQLMTEGGEGWGEDVAAGLSTLARLKRTGITWSSKREFIAMVGGKVKRT